MTNAGIDYGLGRSTEKREYAYGTWMRVRYPWGINLGAAAMCSDGKVRICSHVAQTADTFFSIPASVRVKGKTVSGYITFATKSGSSAETAEDPMYVQFRQHTDGKNVGLLPAWSKA